MNSGQVCAATSRLFIQKSIAEPLIEKLKANFDALSKGLGADPQEQTAQYCPLVDQGQYKKVWQYIQDGKKTAKLLTGGDEFKGQGYYIAPALFVDPDVESDLYKQEIFGPVLCVKTFETEEEAIKLANDSEYGLNGKSA